MKKRTVAVVMAAMTARNDGNRSKCTGSVEDKTDQTLIVIDAEYPPFRYKVFMITENMCRIVLTLTLPRKYVR